MSGLGIVDEDCLETVPRCRYCRVVCEYEEDWVTHCSTEDHKQRSAYFKAQELQKRIEKERRKIQKRLEAVERAKCALSQNEEGYFPPQDVKIKKNPFKPAGSREQAHTASAMLLPQPKSHTTVVGKSRHKTLVPSQHTARSSLGPPRWQPATKNTFANKHQQSNVAGNGFSFSQAAKTVSKVSFQSTAFNFQMQDSIFGSGNSIRNDGGSQQKLFVLDNSTLDQTSHVGPGVVKIEHEIEPSVGDYECDVTVESQGEDVCDVHPDCSPDDTEYFDDDHFTATTSGSSQRYNELFPRRKMMKLDHPMPPRRPFF